MAIDLHQNVSGLGLITATFYIGVGLFQVPGGILAARIGLKRTAIIGTVVASAASLSTGLAADLYQIAFTRFLVGLGMAFVFAPGVVLISRTATKGSEGFAVGLYNSAFYLGGVMGLFGWAVLAELLGWRTSLLFSGGLGIMTAMLLFVVLPKDVRRVEFQVRSSSLKRILLDRWLLAVGFTLLALGVGSTVFSSFAPFYAHQALGLDTSLAGGIGGLGVLFAFLSAPFAGRIYDTFFNVKRLLLYASILMAIGISMPAFSNIYATVGSSVLVGIASGCLTFGFLSAKNSVKLEPEYETLAVSWVNSVSLFGGFVPPLVFSATVIGFGYSFAWLISGILTIALLIPIIIMRMPGQRNPD